MQSDKEKIKKAIMDYYHKGHVKSDGEQYREILHDEWKIFWLDQQNNLQIADKETYISWYKPDNVDNRLTWNTQFYYIDVSGDLASVKLKISNQQFGYTCTVTAILSHCFDNTLIYFLHIDFDHDSDE